MSGEDHGEISSFSSKQIRVPLNTNRAIYSGGTNRSRDSCIIRVKDLKSHLKQLQNSHSRTLSNCTKTRKSLSLISRKTQQMNITFMKLYTNKKIRSLSRQSEQNKRREDKLRIKQLNQTVRERKQAEELQLGAVRILESQRNDRQKQYFRRSREKIKKEARLNQLHDRQANKQQFRAIRDHQRQTLMHNRKIEEIIVMKGKLNYAEQAERQMQQIKAYEKILSELEPYSTVNTFRKCFITANETDNDCYEQKKQNNPGSTTNTMGAELINI